MEHTEKILKVNILQIVTCRIMLTGIEQIRKEKRKRKMEGLKDEGSCLVKQV